MNPQESHDIHELVLVVRHLASRVDRLEGSWVQKVDFDSFREEYNEDRRFLRNVFVLLLFSMLGGFASVLWVLVQRGIG